ncbi:MAG: hypothetical protein EOS51_01980 [Mesorhizobium sp.]|uniref:hypothetical protein n=1 Tax=unclassified Mesorhizobium TaxID=325217 RepID=UPI000FE77236|nr:MULTISPECIES: hypothetical protein [unclassified Mesorhizobium]RWC25010.1 MAG: hypothetical protein EOS51_01980 [Mesorhizobium sp.]TGU00214.1 hypothetical protein EN807_10305 [Mesorhizobium sp. M5C.F.Ca.ET.164.01.1.1]
MSSSISADVARTATERDLLVALGALNPLPRRVSINPELEFAAFKTGLEGKQVGQIVVAYVDLMSAVRSIIQGALRHGYHPSPAELRMHCDAKRAERYEEGAAERRRKAIAEEAAAFAPTIERSEESKARVKALHEDFLRSHAEAKLNGIGSARFTSGVRR